MSTLILFVPDSVTREQIATYFREYGYQVEAASTICELRNTTSTFAFDVLIADVDSSVDMLRELSAFRRDETPESELLLLISQGLIAEAPEVAEETDFDAIERPFSMDRLRMHVVRVLESRRLRYEMQSLRHERALIHDTAGIVAVSKATQEMLALADRVAQSDSTVLLNGETGTGKEIIAGAIHYGSSRANGPFVKLNCAALPTELLLSELFGHEKGAFTGANQQRTGRFEHANTGTIFLDEIGDMSLETQAKVLRVVRNESFNGSGATGPFAPTSGLLRRRTNGLRISWTAVIFERTCSID